MYANVYQKPDGESIVGIWHETREEAVFFRKRTRREYRPVGMLRCVRGVIPDERY